MDLGKLASTCLLHKLISSELWYAFHTIAQRRGKETAAVPEGMNEITFEALRSIARHIMGSFPFMIISMISHYMTLNILSLH